MGIHFSHILGIVRINASHEICKKPIALECLCFPIRFPYYENSVFPCYRICIGFYFTRNIITHNFPVLSHYSHVFSFRNCMDFCFSRNMEEPLDLGMFCFLITFLHYWKWLSPCFGDNNADVKTNEKFFFLIPFPHRRLFETLYYGSKAIFFLSPTQYQRFRSLWHGSMKIYTVQKSR